MPKIQNPIGWTDETINCVIGCSKVSAGCAHCYAEVGTYARVLRHRKVNPIETWGSIGQRVPIKSFGPTLRRLNKLCICDKCHETYPIVQENLTCDAGETFCGGKLRRIRLFADSNSDWLDDKWPVETLATFLYEILYAENIDVQLLTKRAARFEERLHLVNNYCGQNSVMQEVTKMTADWVRGRVPANVWLGVSVENQDMADLRIPQLLKIPAAVRFLSCEPLLESIEFSNVTKRADAVEQLGRKALDGINWVIVGGESGPKRREVPVEAIISIHDQCKAAKVPVYIKQDCALVNGTQGRIPDAIFACKQFQK